MHNLFGELIRNGLFSHDLYLYFIVYLTFQVCSANDIHGLFLTTFKLVANRGYLFIGAVNSLFMFRQDLGIVTTYCIFPCLEQIRLAS